MKINFKLAAVSLALSLAAFAWLTPASHAQTAQSQASPTQASQTQPSQTQASQTKTADAAAHTIPVIDGGIGSCSAAFSVNDENAAPVYDAKIKVHIAYGFWYARKMDLEVGTNIDGKARFEGLPARTKAGLNFTATKGDTQGTAFVDPNTTCKSDLTITLQKKP